MAIATLIAAGRLDDRLIDRALGLLREVDPKARFAPLDRRGRRRRSALRRRFQGRALGAESLDDVDVVVQPDEPRWQRLLVADMDSTIIGQECIDELADYAGPQGPGRADHRAGDAGRARFHRPRCASACGCSPASTARAQRAASTSAWSVTAGAETLVQTMRAGGASCLLVSGGFLSFAEPVARTVGFDRVKANRLVFAGGKLSGEVGDPIVDAMAKRDALVEAREELGLGAGRCARRRRRRQRQLMIEEAGLGVAFRAKPALAKVADAELRAPRPRRLAVGPGRQPARLVRG